MSSFWPHNVRRSQILKIFVNLDSPMSRLCFHPYLAHSSSTKLPQINFLRWSIKFAPRPPPTNQHPPTYSWSSNHRWGSTDIFSTQPKFNSIGIEDIFWCCCSQNCLLSLFYQNPSNCIYIVASIHVQKSKVVWGKGLLIKKKKIVDLVHFCPSPPLLPTLWWTHVFFFCELLRPAQTQPRPSPEPA